MLIRIQYGERGRRTFVSVGQMMIGDDDVQSLIAGPNQRLVCGDAAIDANDQLVAFVRCFLQRVLPNAVTFGKAMRHVIAGRRAQHAQRSQKHRRARRAIDVIVAVNQNRFLIVNRAQQALHRVCHAPHQKWIVKLIKTRIKKSSG